MRSVIIAVAIGAAAVAAAAGARAQSSRAAKSTADGFYGEEQARRGKTQFGMSCASCHTVDRAQATGIAGGDSGTSNRAMLPLTGEDVIRKWRTIGDLYGKVRRTMPAMNAGGLTNANYLDIVAYMLQANGLPAGKDLTSDLSALHKLVLANTAPDRVAVNDVSTGRFYTEAQAKRGEGYFLGNCNTCHTTNPDGTFTAAELAIGKKGSMFGGGYRPWPIGGGATRLQRWANVFNLFNKVRSMPAHDPGGLSLETYLDITAYFLKVYGAPAGGEELHSSLNAMKSMALNEPGFEKVFNGRDFTGIKFVVGANCAPRPAGCGQTQPGEAFRVEDGTILTPGTPEGYWYPDKKYLTFTLRADYRYTRPRDLENDDEFTGNSGYLLFISQHGVWPKCIEIQGQNSGVMGAFGVGADMKATVDNDARKRAIKPVGQWNSFEIVSKDNMIMTFLNGTPIATVTEHEFKGPGYIGFQSEGGQIQWRNIRIKAE